MSTTNILFILAHLDDEAFGPSGTIATLAQTHNVYVHVIGNGVRPDDTVNKLNRLKVFYQIVDILNIKDFSIEDVYDTQFEYYDIIHSIEQAINKFKPSVVYTHNISDINKDHRMVADATMVACRPKPQDTNFVHSVSGLYMYEIPSSTGWNFNQLTPHFEPTTFFNITSHINTKKKCLKLYDTEVYKYPDARSIEACITLAKHRGCQVGVNFAEGFKQVFSIIQ